MKVGDKIRVKRKGIADHYDNVQGFIMQILEDGDIQVRITCGLEVASCTYHPDEVYVIWELQ